jgi:hypothetical protein
MIGQFGISSFDHVLVKNATALHFFNSMNMMASRVKKSAQPRGRWIFNHLSYPNNYLDSFETLQCATKLD